MADFKELISLITSSVDKLNAQIPDIQKSVLNDILLQIKKLDTNGDRIRIAGNNLKILTQVQSRLQGLMLQPEYLSSVKEYASSYNDVLRIQNNYFNDVAQKFKPPKLANEIKKQALESVVNQLTENGLQANVTDKVKDLIRQAVTGGGSYSTLSKQLTDFLLTNKSGDGQLVKYVKQISTDAINQFSGQYTQMISSDLGFEWYRYSGSNIETTRPFCLACTERKFFHICELPKVLKGQFDEFRKFNGKVSEKTDLPNGMIPGTDVTNFMTNRGGYNCGHQWRPCSDDIVPVAVKQRVYASAEYKAWKGIDVKSPAKKSPDTIVDKDIVGKSLRLDVTGGLTTALTDLVNRGRKIITDNEKSQLIKLNDLKQRKSVGKAKLYSTKTQHILQHELDTIDKLLTLGHDVIYMPDLFFNKGDKKFDVLVFNKNSYYKADIKEIKSKNSNTISESISYGGIQSGGHVIIDVHGNVDHSVLADGISKAFKGSRQMKSVIVFYKNKRKTYYRDQVASKNFPVEFYNTFIR